MGRCVRRRRPSIRWASAIAFAAVVLGARGAAAKPVDFDLSVSPKVGTDTDTYVVTVRIEVDGISGPDRYWPPVFRDFTLVDSQIQQQTTTMMFDPNKGQQLRTTEIRRYFLQPKRVGALEIEPARLRIRQQDYESRRIFVTVRGTGAAAPTRTVDPDPTSAGGVGAPGFVKPNPKGNPDMFLHVVADKRDPYVGEQVIVTWLLYTRSEVLKFEPRPPRLDGLWSEKLYEPDSFFRYHDDVIHGIPYEVAIVSKRALFPTQSGKLQVQPFVANVSSLYSALGDAKRVASPPIELEVKPLPDGAPPAFDPTYVGVFEVESEVDRNEIDAGESMTLSVLVRAHRGAIRRTSPPTFEPEGFKTREPRDFDESVDTSTDVVRGERVYRYWITPEQGGRQTIPPVQIAYFDPQTGRYELAESRPIPVLVRGDPSALAQDPSSERKNFIAPDIRLIRDGSTISSIVVSRMYRSRWFWLVAAAPGALFFFVVVVDRIRGRMRKDTPRARLRRARGRARKRFRVAEIHLRGNRPSRFFGELVHVIYDHLEERVGQPVQQMTHEELRAFLSGKGFSQATIERIDGEVQNCDFARFAPSASGPGEMKAALRRTKDLLREIEKTRLVGDEPLPDSEGGAS